MNVIIWARVSSREQREGYSIDAQLRSCRERAREAGWTIIKEFVVTESARRGADRQAFQDMLKWVRKNAGSKKVSAILSHKLDRVCRNMRDAVRLQELEDDHRVRLAKSLELKDEQSQAEASLADGPRVSELRDTALQVFDWSQNAADIWRGSNNEVRREILDSLCLNRTLGDVSLHLPMRKPFESLAEGLVLKISRGDWI